MIHQYLNFMVLSTKILSFGVLLEYLKDSKRKRKHYSCHYLPLYIIIHFGFKYLKEFKNSYKILKASNY